MVEEWRCDENHVVSIAICRRPLSLSISRVCVCVLIATYKRNESSKDQDQNQRVLELLKNQNPKGRSYSIGQARFYESALQQSAWVRGNNGPTTTTTLLVYVKGVPGSEGITTHSQMIDW
jgi:hypothetical protein